MFFFHFWFHGSACNIFGGGGAKYINFREKIIFFILIYIHAPPQPQGSSILEQMSEKQVTNILLLFFFFFENIISCYLVGTTISHMFCPCILKKIGPFFLCINSGGPNRIRGLTIFSPKHLLQEQKLKFSILNFSRLKNMTCQLIIVEFLMSIYNNFTTLRTNPIVYDVTFHCLLIQLHQMSV